MTTVESGDAEKREEFATAETQEAGGVGVIGGRPRTHGRQKGIRRPGPIQARGWLIDQREASRAQVGFVASGAFAGRTGATDQWLAACLPVCPADELNSSGCSAPVYLSLTSLVSEERR